MRIYKVDIQILLCNLICINANFALFLPHATLESKFLDNLHGISMYIFKQNSVAHRVYKILVKPSLCGSKKYCILRKWKLRWRPKTSVADRGIKRNYFKKLFYHGTRYKTISSLLSVFTCMHAHKHLISLKPYHFVTSHTSNFLPALNLMNVTLVTYIWYWILSNIICNSLRVPYLS